MSTKVDKEPDVIDVTPAESGAVVSFRERIKEELAKAADMVDRPSAGFISTKGKKFTLPTGESSEDPLEVVVLSFANNFSYFPNKYNPKATERPTCYARGKVLDTLTPSEFSEDRQAAACSTCPQNEWGSGENGAKACKQTFQLAVIPAGMEPSATVPILRINVSPTARKFWSKYVAELATSGLTSVEVVTEMSFDPESDYAKLRFKSLGRNPNLEGCSRLFDEAEELLLRDSAPRDD